MWYIGENGMGVVLWQGLLLVSPWGLGTRGVGVNLLSLELHWPYSELPVNFVSRDRRRAKTQNSCFNFQSSVAIKQAPCSDSTVNKKVDAVGSLESLDAVYAHARQMCKRMQ